MQPYQIHKLLFPQVTKGINKEFLIQLQVIYDQVNAPVCVWRAISIFIFDQRLTINSHPITTEWFFRCPGIFSPSCCFFSLLATCVPDNTALMWESIIVRSFVRKEEDHNSSDYIAIFSLSLSQGSLYKHLTHTTFLFPSLATFFWGCCSYQSLIVAHWSWRWLEAVSQISVAFSPSILPFFSEFQFVAMQLFI